MWINIACTVAIGLMLPVYCYMHKTHQSIQIAKSTGVWTQIPTMLPTQTEVIDILQNQAKALGITLHIQDSQVTVETSDPLSIYHFLYCMIQIPALCIQSFDMKQEKQKVVATIKMIIQANVKIASGYAPPCIKQDLFTPRFFYVNAITEVDGQKQVWVNGQNYGQSCPWPLYHTFDKQTDTIKRGDLRPRLSLTSST